MIMLEGLCPHGAKSFGAISLSPVVPAVCFGIVGPLQRRVRAVATITTLQSFLQNNPPICALNLKLLYYGLHLL